MERLRKIGFSKLTLLEDALKLLEPHVRSTPIEEIDVINALNRILAEDLNSNMDVPHFNRAAMDGYAIKAEDSFGASPKNPKKVRLIGTVEIGERGDLKLSNGEAIRISTGAPVPEGSDAVIKIEDTQNDNDIISFYTALVPGKNIAKAGEDIKKGTKVLEKGTKLKAEHLALISSLGFEKIKVCNKPRISLFVSGDELLKFGDPLKPGKIYDSNTTMISNLISLYGGLLIRSNMLRDNKQTLIEALNSAINDSDMIIFTGGTSVGTKDLLPEIIQEKGKIIVHGIAMRPGSPLLIGIVSDCLIFCLPGTPVAAYICFLDVVGPTIRKMMGSKKSDPRDIIYAKITKDVPLSGLGNLNHLRVRIEAKEDSYDAIPVKLKGSGVITSLTESDGIVEILPLQEGLKKGEMVKVKLFPK